MPLKNSYIEDDPLWYKDAIIYELHVKSFFDSNDDGIGDFKGLIKKLDYLQNLGITAIWLLPFYPSPLRDDGYDIADYFNINPAYGTLRDFKDFLNQAHRRGLRVITELVLNHTSDQNPWFQQSRRAKTNSPWRDFYIWNNTPDKYKEARIIFKDFENSNWAWDTVAKAYYWHRFYSHQPDLNYDNPKVQKMMIKVIDFWLEMGVDGLRLDAVPYLYKSEGTNCENLPETHLFLKKLREHVDKKFKNRMLLAEANQWTEDTVAYFGNSDECHMAFNFPVMPRMFMALQMEDRFPVIDILENNFLIAESCQWALFLRNHDELTLEMVTDEERDYMYKVYASDPRSKINLGIRRRLAPLLWNNRKKIEVLNILLLSLPGTPVIYYGDEIGMGDNYYLGDRDGVRTPMQWSPDRNAGFSKTNPHKLYLPVVIDPEYHFESMNVENQERNLSSLLWWMKRVIDMRKKYKAFGRGGINFLTPRNAKVLSFIREYENEFILVVINLSRFSQVVELDLSKYIGYIPEEVFSHNRFPVIKDTSYTITLCPYNYYWFLLKKEKGAIDLKKESDISCIYVISDLNELFMGKPREKLEQEIFVEYFKRCRWFGGKARTICKISIIENSSIYKKYPFAHLLILEVDYNDGPSEKYLLPLFFESRNKGISIKKQFPQAIIAQIKIGEEEGILYDGVYSEKFHHFLFEMIVKRKKLRGINGEFIAFNGKKLKNFFIDKQFPIKSHVLKTEQSNTSIIYEDTFILKLFRKLEYGANPDTEILRELTDHSRFSQVPKFCGAVEYKMQSLEFISAGLLENYVPNVGDGWTYTLDNVSQYFDRILSKKFEITKEPQITSFNIEKDSSEEYLFLRGFIGEFFLEMITLLGQRTGELHLSLFNISGNPDFEPEPFSTLYQRSIYQSMRNLVKQTFRILKTNTENFSNNLKKEIIHTLESEENILKRLGRILEKNISSMKIRIHGDYHLGQVLFTGKDFVIIDFEGEPARALSERRLKRSALRDVAGMVRSFHYAAYAGLLRNPSVRSKDKAFLEPWMSVWYHYVTNIFLDSYINTVGDAPFLPKKLSSRKGKKDFNILFEAFLLEKAVYELGYEINNRPDWVIIPIYGIKYILDNDIEDN